MKNTHFTVSANIVYFLVLLQFLPNAKTLKVIVMPKASQPLTWVTMP